MHTILFIQALMSLLWIVKVFSSHFEQHEYLICCTVTFFRKCCLNYHHSTIFMQSKKTYLRSIKIDLKQEVVLSWLIWSYPEMVLGPFQAIHFGPTD